MKTLPLSLMLLLVMVFLAGCGRAKFQPRTGADEVVLEGLRAGGGLDRFQSISRISGTALVKLYDKDGVAVVRGQEFTAYPRWGMITARGQLPGGSWHGYVWMKDKGVVLAGGDARLSSDDKRQIEDYLRLMLHGLRGAMNLVDGGEQAADVSSIFADSRPMYRVEAVGRPQLAQAYYFDQRYHDLRLITTGKDTPPGSGTVTVLKNETINGVLLPTGMEVMEIGANSLIGSRTRLSIELQDVRVRVRGGFAPVAGARI